MKYVGSGTENRNGQSNIMYGADAVRSDQTFV